jgi:hypothetical protein
LSALLAQRGVARAGGKRKLSATARLACCTQLTRALRLSTQVSSALSTLAAERKTSASTTGGSDIVKFSFTRI